MKLTSQRLIHLPTAVLGLCSTTDGRRLYAACHDGAIYPVEADTKGHSKVPPLPHRHQSYASSCLLLPDQKTLISGGYDGAIVWQNIETGELIRKEQAHRFWSWRLALSPDGQTLASVTGQYLSGGEKYEPLAENEPSVRLYAAQTGKALHALSHVPPVMSAAFTPDGKHLAAGNLMGEIRLWDITTGQIAAQWTSPDFTAWGTTKSHHYTGGIYDLMFAPDGQSLFACGMGSVHDPMAGNGAMTWQRWAWQEKPARLIATTPDTQRGAGLMETLAWHPRGQAFLMAGRQAQGTWNAALYSTQDGKFISSIDTKKRITRSLFSPDGKIVYLAGMVGQPQPKEGKWGDYGRIGVYEVGEA
jgi:WD40 repeat protein